MSTKSVICVLLFSLLFQFSSSQVGIGTGSPKAALDINSNNSGVLLPRIDLLSPTDNTSVVNPDGGSLVEGTMVWNTALSGLKPSGYYYWQDGKWNQVADRSQKTVHFGKMIINSSGTKTVTGLGFQPTSIDFIAINRVQNYDNGAYRSDGNNTNDIRLSGGSMTGYATNYGGIKSQQVISIGTNGASINNIGTYSSDSHCIASFFTNQDGEPIHDNGSRSTGSDSQGGLIRASLTSFDADGFTLNVDRFLAGAATGSLTNQIVVIFKAYR